MLEQTVMPTAGRAWPMTSEAAHALADAIGRERQRIAALAGEGLEEGVAHLSLSQSLRRLDTLLATERRAEVRDDRDCAAIGRQATVRHEDGAIVCYSIVYPGDGDPARGCVSADSPLGSALLGARPGAAVRVAAPGGSWSVVVVAIE